MIVRGEVIYRQSHHCPICGKTFLASAQWGYRRDEKYYCSYHCMIADQSGQDEIEFCLNCTEDDCPNNIEYCPKIKKMRAERKQNAKTDKATKEKYYGEDGKR